MSIFEEQKLYPSEGEIILGSFEKHYDCVFVAYLPFFRLKNGEFKYPSVQKSHQISLEKLQAEDKLFANLPNFKANVFSYENDEYPEDEVIFEAAETVSWDEVKNGADFNDHGEINKALRTSIGSYRKVFERDDLCQKLLAYTEKENIFHPTEGSYGILSKVAIYKILKSLSKDEISIIDEFYLNEKKLDLSSLTLKAFVEVIEGKDYYIYPKDKSILFTIDWDSFFFLICSNKSTIDVITSKLMVDGFVCTSETKHTWEWDESEFLRILESESDNDKRSRWTKLKDFVMKK